MDEPGNAERIPLASTRALALIERVLIELLLNGPGTSPAYANRRKRSKLSRRAVVGARRCGSLAAADREYRARTRERDTPHSERLSGTTVRWRSNFTSSADSYSNWRS